jgi:hypothetical protein
LGGGRLVLGLGGTERKGQGDCRGEGKQFVHGGFSDGKVMNNAKPIAGPPL